LNIKKFLAIGMMLVQGIFLNCSAIGPDCPSIKTIEELFSFLQNKFQTYSSDPKDIQNCNALTILSFIGLLEDSEEKRENYIPYRNIVNSCWQLFEKNQPAHPNPKIAEHLKKPTANAFAIACCVNDMCNKGGIKCWHITIYTLDQLNFLKNRDVICILSDNSKLKFIDINNSVLSKNLVVKDNWDGLLTNSDKQAVHAACVNLEDPETACICQKDIHVFEQENNCCFGDFEFPYYFHQTDKYGAGITKWRKHLVGSYNGIIRNATLNGNEVTGIGLNLWPRAIVNKVVSENRSQSLDNLFKKHEIAASHLVRKHMPD
jgi:hypothetical protein